MIDFSTNLLKLSEEKMNNRTNKNISARKKNEQAPKKQIIKDDNKNIYAEESIEYFFTQTYSIKIYTHIKIIYDRI